MNKNNLGLWTAIWLLFGLMMVQQIEFAGDISQLQDSAILAQERIEALHGDINNFGVEIRGVLDEETGVWRPEKSMPMAISRTLAVVD